MKQFFFNFTGSRSLVEIKPCVHKKVFSLLEKLFLLRSHRIESLKNFLLFNRMQYPCSRYKKQRDKHKHNKRQEFVTSACSKLMRQITFNLLYYLLLSGFHVYEWIYVDLLYHVLTSIMNKHQINVERLLLYVREEMFSSNIKMWWMITDRIIDSNRHVCMYLRGCRIW